MKKFLVLLFAFAFMLGAAVPVFAADRFFPPPAEDKPKADKDDKPIASDRLVHAKRSAWVKLDGELKLDIIHRTQYLNALLTGAAGDSTVYNPEVTLGLKFFMGKDVYGFVKLETPAFLQDDFGSDNIRIPAVDEAYVELGSVFPDVFGEEKFKLKIGVQGVKFDLRENNDSFFMDVANSASPFDPGSYPAYNSSMTGLWMTSDRYGNTPDGALEFNDAGKASSTEFGGFRFVYDNVRQTGVRLDLLFGTTKETYQASQDESLAMFAFTFKFPKDLGKTYTYLSMFSNDPASKVYSLGFGLRYFVMNDIELFAEIVGQTGTFLDNYDPNDTTKDHPANLALDAAGNPLIGEKIAQQAVGGYAGFKYKYRKFWQPFAEVSYWYLSGDADPFDTKQQNFISYEDVDETIVMEENEYGLDMDTNYQAFKFKTGFSPVPDRMTFQFLYAYFTRARDYTDKDRIAQEIDVSLKWAYTESCTFTIGAGNAWDLDYLQLPDKNLFIAFMNVRLKF